MHLLLQNSLIYSQTNVFKQSVMFWYSPEQDKSGWHYKESFSLLIMVPTRSLTLRVKNIPIKGWLFPTEHLKWLGHIVYGMNNYVNKFYEKKILVFWSYLLHFVFFFRCWQLNPGLTEWGICSTWIIFIEFCNLPSRWFFFKPNMVYVKPPWLWILPIKSIQTP